MILNEIFDQPKKPMWLSNTMAYFSVDGKAYMVHFRPAGRDATEFHFSVSATGEDGTVYQSWEVEGDGNGIQVFSAVIGSSECM